MLCERDTTLSKCHVHVRCWDGPLTRVQSNRDTFENSVSEPIKDFAVAPGPWLVWPTLFKETIPNIAALKRLCYIFVAWCYNFGSESESEDGSRRMWPNVTRIKFKSITSTVNVISCFDFLQQWWLFNNEDKNSHDPMRLTCFVLIERPLGAGITNCAFKAFLFLPGMFFWRHILNMCYLLRYMSYQSTFWE